MDTTWMNVSAVAKYLGISKKAVYCRVRRKQLPFHKKSGRILFFRPEVDAFLLSA